MSVLHGLSPNASQMRDTVVCDIPVALAMSLLDQWVTSLGLSVRS